MPPEPNPESIGRYAVEALVGRAGQTAVYRCRDVASGRTVAVKLFPRRLSEDPVAYERFQNEVAALKSFSRYPGFVRIFDSGQEGNQPYVVMEWVEGTSLDRRVQGRRLSLPEVFGVMKGICRTLAYAHTGGHPEGGSHPLRDAAARPRVHGGLTPRNVLVSDDLKTVKIAGLGLAPFESTAPGSLTSTLSTGEIHLTALYYLAPEVIDGADDVDGRADLYSAGAIFHELLTGRKPTGRFNLPSQIDSDLPQQVDPLPLKALARHREDRYATALELLEEIERVEEELDLRLVSHIKAPQPSPAAGSDGEAPPEKERSTLPVLAFLSLVLVVLAMLGYLFFR